MEVIGIERGTFSVKNCIKMGEGLAEPPQMKRWVAPPHLPQGGAILIFSLLGHVMADSSSETQGQEGDYFQTILNACLVTYKELTP